MKKNLKAAIVLALSFVMVLSLTACGSKEEKKTADTKTEQTEKTEEKKTEQTVENSDENTDETAE